jgi:aminoglycoside/choline kinase family phosphotransferase
MPHQQQSHIISPDGSDRSFSIIEWNGKQAIKIMPSKGDQGFSEAKSYVQIGRHLRNASIPVPDIYKFYDDTGVVIAEFIEGRHLQDEVRDKLASFHINEVEEIYKNLLTILSKMQVKGAEDFDVSWCCDTPYYDSRLAFEREAMYFLRFFVEKFMGLEYEGAIKDELKKASEQVDRIKERNFFLHRDFQSRNIIYNKGQFHIVDFQAGRLGPLFYDPSSLLLDPYVGLPMTILKKLIKFYIKILESLGVSFKLATSIKQFYDVALLRTLQVLGAFSYLTLVKKRPFFRPYIAPALVNLNFILEQEQFKNLLHLKTCSEAAFEKYEKKFS